MVQRVTRSDVEGMYQRAEGAALLVGLDTHGWYLVRGSASNGRAWRLYTRPGGGDALAGLDRGFLGMTAREARDTLHTLAVAWEAVATVVGVDRRPGCRCPSAGVMVQPDCEVCWGTTRPGPAYYNG